MLPQPYIVSKSTPALCRNTTSTICGNRKIVISRLMFWLMAGGVWWLVVVGCTVCCVMFLSTDLSIFSEYTCYTVHGNTVIAFYQFYFTPTTKNVPDSFFISVRNVLGWVYIPFLNWGKGNYCKAPDLVSLSLMQFIMRSPAVYRSILTCAKNWEMRRLA